MSETVTAEAPHEEHDVRDAGEDHLEPGELSRLFLFEHLDPDQLGWLSANGRLETRAAGEVVYLSLIHI